MKIIIATPLWPPELGGPANYAKSLAREFREIGHSVKVVSFVHPVRSQPRRDVGAADAQAHRISNGAKDISRIDPQDLNSVSFVSLNYISGLRHFLFFCRLLPKLYRDDILLALDQVSVGLPAAMACLLLRKPLILRVEGDFLWESFVERTRKDVTLRQFYENPPPLVLKERFIRKVTEWVLRRADCLVFSSEWRRLMILRSFKLPVEKTLIIGNVWPRISNQLPVTGNQKIILWAGRMLYLKNLRRLLRAFANVNDGSYELHLVGEGTEQKNLELFIKKEGIGGVKFFSPLSQEKLLEKYSEAAFFVLPSLSDVGPNVITEAVGAGTPCIMTKESGYAEYVKDFGLLVDPLNEDDLAAKIRILMDGPTRKEYKNRLKLLVFQHDWHETAGEWIALFREVGRGPYRPNGTRKK